ncbi:hypothetical protein [Echinicola soli]|uniref:hypothetical protein n=1 Tax=Echinicola soli TaxID=2591634 RepID=UPI0037424C12
MLFVNRMMILGKYRISIRYYQVLSIGFNSDQFSHRFRMTIQRNTIKFIPIGHL